MPDQNPDPAPVTPEATLAAALAYRRAGLSILPISADGSKSPATTLLPLDEEGRHSWRQFQSRLPTEQEIRSWYEVRWGSLCGIGVIGGRISGNLEIIDIDSFDVAELWMATVQQQAPNLLSRLVLILSPRPGLHVYFRSPLVGRNEKLARAKVANQETGALEIQTLIEVKSEGGYCLAPASPPECHASGRVYRYVLCQDLTQVPTITEDERNLLMAIARSFDRCEAGNRNASARRRRCDHNIRPHTARATTSIYVPRGPTSLVPMAGFSSTPIRMGWSIGGGPASEGELPQRSTTQATTCCTSFLRMHPPSRIRNRTPSSPPTHFWSTTAIFGPRLQASEHKVTAPKPSQPAGGQDGNPRQDRPRLAATAHVLVDIHLDRLILGQARFFTGNSKNLILSMVSVHFVEGVDGRK